MNKAYPSTFQDFLRQWLTHKMIGITHVMIVIPHVVLVIPHVVLVIPHVIDVIPHVIIVIPHNNDCNTTCNEWVNTDSST